MASQVHVDDFIDDAWTYRDHKYARFVLNYFRMPATLQNDFKEWMKQFKLFCTYEGKRYRCTGASRMGDVWLATDFNRETGYDLRVNVTDCTEWSDKPELTTEQPS